MRQRGMALLLTLVLLPALAAGLVWLAQGTHLMQRFEGHQVADRVATIGCIVCLCAMRTARLMWGVEPTGKRRSAGP